MNTDKQRIYNGDWKTLHPYSGSAPTDLYYITLANKVLAAIRAVETSLEESDYRKIDETEQKELACILTAYFEDIISQTGIFQAFTRIHGKRFGKPLPFYTLDEDYTPGEINIEEVQFLVWHYHMQLNNLDSLRRDGNIRDRIRIGSRKRKATPILPNRRKRIS